MMSPRLKIVITSLVPVVAFLLDRGTKLIARKMAVTAGTRLQTGILDTIVHENHGIVANVPVPIPVIIAATLIIVAVLIAVWARAMSRGRLVEVIALGLIIGGACSNLFDRYLFGFVYDWILIFNRSVVNVADITIVFGAILYGVEVGKKRVVEK